jgi:hypothetical protein
MFNLKLSDKNILDYKSFIDKLQNKIFEKIGGYKTIFDSRSYEMVIGQESEKAENCLNLDLIVRKSIKIDKNRLTDKNYIEDIQKSVCEFIERSKEIEKIGE